MLFWTLHAILALLASQHILLHKRQPRSALIWLAWVWALPWAGPLGYLYFGYNRVGRPPHRPVPQWTPGRRPSFEALALAVAGTPLRTGNRLRLLRNGNEGYPAMLAAIRRARVSVDLQTYIFDLDAVGEAFLSALEEAARRGVRVRVLVDGLAAYAARLPLRVRLRRAGGEARVYWRLDRLFRQPLLNLRNHRKLLVVDGRLAFIGGLNISARYAKGPLARLRDLRFLASGRPRVRDLHFAVSGSLVPDLAESFAADWAHSGGAPAPGRARDGRVCLGPGSVGPVAARVVRAGPDEDLERIYEVLLGALSLAKRQVDLCSPYFIPDAALLATLRGLGYRGVRVRVFLPRQSDHPWMCWASQEYYHDLLDAGVEVWEVDAPFIHTKLAVVDRHWVLLGSSNLDPRSFRLNFEVGVEARSPLLAGQATALLESYRASAHRIDLARIRRRPAWQRLRGALVNLAAPYL